MTNPRPTPTTNLIFRPDSRDYVAGDDRSYDVIVRGRIIGVVERDWLVSATPGGEPIRGWVFGDGERIGEGRSRKAAVLAAYAD